MLQKFREIMRDYDKKELLLEQDNQSKINEEDLDELKRLKFKNGATEKYWKIIINYEESAQKR